jgi:hypothetical protein
MARTWTCQNCRTVSAKVKKRCPACGRKRPVRKAAHLRVLEDPYEVWVERFGDRCNICGRAASASRRLDRDHCHGSGAPRGLLCNRCNRALPAWVDADWLEAAAVYLRRFEEADPPPPEAA